MSGEVVWEEDCPWHVEGHRQTGAWAVIARCPTREFAFIFSRTIQVVAGGETRVVRDGEIFPDDDLERGIREDVH